MQISRRAAAAGVRCRGEWGRRPEQSESGAAERERARSIGQDEEKWGRSRGGRSRYLAKCHLCVAHYVLYAPRIFDT
jgi:hypothetical protein